MSVELIDSVIGTVEKEIKVYDKDLRGKSGKGEIYEQAWVDCLCYVNKYILGPIREQEEAEQSAILAAIESYKNKKIRIKR